MYPLLLAIVPIFLGFLLCCCCSCDSSSGDDSSSNPTPTPTPTPTPKPQSDPCVTGELVIKTNDDAQKISGCLNFKGNILIHPAAQGQINIDGVERLTGNLDAYGSSKLNALSASSLTIIDGDLHVQDLPSLSTWNFPQLTSVQEMFLTSLPVLQSADCSTLEAKSVEISKTGLRALENVNLRSVSRLNINSNSALSTVRFSNLSNVNETFRVSGDCDLDLPVLEQAGQLSFTAISSVSLPLLQHLDSDFVFQNSYLQKIFAPELATIGGALIATENVGLAGVDLPSLTTVSSEVLLRGNDQLTTTIFNNLTTVDGDLKLLGTFDSVSFDMWRKIAGDVQFITTSENASAICEYFRAAKSAGVIRGQVYCTYLGLKSQISGGTSGGIVVCVVFVVSAIAIVYRRHIPCCCWQGSIDEDSDASTIDAELGHTDGPPLSDRASSNASSTIVGSPATASTTASTSRSGVRSHNSDGTSDSGISHLYERYMRRLRDAGFGALASPSGSGLGSSSSSGSGPGSGSRSTNSSLNNLYNHYMRRLREAGLGLLSPPGGSGSRSAQHYVHGAATDRLAVANQSGGNVLIRTVRQITGLVRGVLGTRSHSPAATTGTAHQLSARNRHRSSGRSEQSRRGSILSGTTAWSQETYQEMVRRPEPAYGPGHGSPSTIEMLPSPLLAAGALPK